MRTGVADAGTQEAQVPQAPAGPDAGPGQGRDRGTVRRIRAAGPGARLDHEPADRGGAYRDDAQDQARREGLDQHLPPQARDQEARRDPHGQRQGEPRVLRRGRQARTRDVRDERRKRGSGAPGHDARRPEAPDKNPLPGARRWSVNEGGRSARAGHRRAGAARRRDAARALQPPLPARNRTVGEHGTAQGDPEEHRPAPDRPEPEEAGERGIVAEEEKNKEEETEQSPAEAVDDLVEGGETVEADLDLGPARGPRLDQDEGRIQSDPERGSRKERVGLVVSDRPDKTVTVSVETLVRHPMYKKRVRRSKRFMVHDESNEARVGDTVRIIETRPLSARKRWRLANVVSRAE